MRTSSYFLLFLLMLLILSGCKTDESKKAEEAKRLDVQYLDIYIESKRLGETCYDGVVYLVSVWRFSPKFNPDSTVVTCEW